MAAIRGTSVTSSIGCSPRATSMRMKVPVVTMTTASVQAVERTLQTRKPYSSVTLTQMKWNGTVSQSPNHSMATRLSPAKIPHAISIQ